MNNYNDFDGREFGNIEEDLSELDKQKIKKNLRLRIRKEHHKKVSHKVMIASIASLFIIGTLATSVVAEKFQGVPGLDMVYEKLGYKFEYYDYTQVIGKSIEEKGFKLTIDNLLMTQNHSIIAFKLEAPKEYDMNKLKTDLWIGVGIGHIPNGEMNPKDINIEGNTAKIIIKGFSPSDINDGRCKLNYFINLAGGMHRNVTIPVDFSNAFAQTKTKKLNAKLSNDWGVVTELSTDIIGSMLKINNGGKLISSDGYTKYMLNLNGKYYEAEEAVVDDKNNAYYSIPDLNFSDITDNDVISIVSISNDLKFDKNFDVRTIGNILDKKVIDNVQYYKGIKYDNGSIAEIYKVEKNGDTIKFYCKGNSEKESLLFASSMDLYKENEKEARTYKRVMYNGNGEDFTYVVEYKGIEDNESYHMDINNTIYYIDKFEISNEIPIK